MSGASSLKPICEKKNASMYIAFRTKVTNYVNPLQIGRLFNITLTIAIQKTKIVAVEPL